MADNKDRTFEAFKQCVPYLRGALWWARNSLIKDRHPTFNQNDDRNGHPLLSVSLRELRDRFDCVPMLVGTSGQKMRENQKKRCVMVRGMTRRDRAHETYFGSIVAPGMYSFSDLLTGAESRKRYYDKHGKIVEGVEGWQSWQTMIPNWDKAKVDDGEMLALNAWCDAHSK